jgi:hypothetical protein
MSDKRLHIKKREENHPQTGKIAFKITAKWPQMEDKGKHRKINLTIGLETKKNRVRTG